MMDAVRNRLNVEATCALQWPINHAINAPYPTKLLISDLATAYPSYLASRPVMCLGNGLVTFQLFTEWEDTESAVPLLIQFETSLDGIHWDKEPGSNFSPSLDTLTMGTGDHSGSYSYTFDVMVNSKYIRALLAYPGEGYDPTATVTINAIQKEA
jgi:hypothetical protein